MQKLKRVSALLLFLSLAAITKTNAQTNDSLLNQLGKKWMNAKAYTLKVAELMPEEYYSFKPVPEEMSFGEQLLHIAQNMTALSSSFLLANKLPANKADAKSLSKNDIMQMVSLAYDSAYTVHFNLTPAQLNNEVKFFAAPMSRRQVLMVMHDHQSHHLGQLIVYLRLKGIKPPGYIGW